MKNKGFTLTELMATIVILGVIIGLVVPTYIITTKNVKQKNYNNKVDYIASKAVEYATEHNVSPSTITVSKLITEGYISKDSRSSVDMQSITNPLGGYLDCYKINITMDNHEYEAEVVASNDCALANDETLSKNIDVEVYKLSNLSSLGKNRSVNWSNENVILLVKFLNGFDSSVDKTKGVTYMMGGVEETKSANKWTSSINKNHATYDNEYLVSASLIMNQTYQVIVYTKDSQTVVKDVDVKIDKENPTLKVDADSVWTTGNKKTTFYGADGTGSGICGYHVGESVLTESEQSNASNFESSSASSIEKNLASGIYYAYARDCVGNVSDVQIIDIDNIDTTGSSCKYPTANKSPNSNGWFNSDVTYTYGCNSDNQSGCYTKDITKTYSTDKKHSETITWQIKDIAGNTTNCSKKVNTNLDKTKPECQNATVPSGWQTADVTLSYGCASDNLSGCDKTYSNKTKKYSDSKITKETISWQIRDLAGNEKTCTQNVEVYVDKVAPTCKNATVPSEWQSGDVTLSYGCASDNLSGCDNTFSSKTKKYTVSEGQSKTISETLSWQIKDNAGNEKTCTQSVTVKIDKVKPSISVKSGLLSMNSGAYDFRNNINASFGPMGGYVQCEPDNNYGLSGVTTVSCQAFGNNGRKSNRVSFEVRHEYPATLISNSCTRTENYNCGNRRECLCGHESCDPWECWCGPWPDGCCKQNFGYTCCKCNEEDVYRCDSRTVTYDCSYYDCPNGGSLSGTTCVYN